MGYSKYSDDTKAAVMAALLQGQSVSSLSREYKIPKGTVSNWKRKAKKKAAKNANSEGGPNNRTQESEVGDLLVSYLHANLETLRAQAEAVRDPQWLKGQDAAALATLHGVMTDKAVRLIEAFGEADDSNASGGR